VTRYDIHVWSLVVEAVPDEAWPALAAVLDDHERARAARFRFECHRRPYVAAHALLRHMLAQCAGRPPEAWRFAATPHGKPEIIDPPDGAPLRFSLTHSDHMVAVAVTRAAEIGIDLEPLDRRLEDGPELAERFFATEEVRALRALPAEERAERFIRLWTLKEAFLKATGMGLAMPLDSFAFVSLDPVRIVFPDHSRGDAGRWAFRQWPVERHMLAVAIDWPAARPPHLVHRQVTPPFGYPIPV
jgi:4'-phosphopantetheinyl transferase